MHCVLHPAVHCVPCSGSAVHAHCRGAVHRALRTMLLVHPSVVPCLCFLCTHTCPACHACPMGGGGTRLQWGVACPPVPAAPPAFGRAARAFPAPAALWTPAWPTIAMPGARLLPPSGPPMPGLGPIDAGGGGSRHPVPLLPRAAAPADSPAQLQAAAAQRQAMFRTPDAHRPSALPLPPRALLFCPGNPQGVLPLRPASVGEQCRPPS